MKKILESALLYVSFGWKVFPLHSIVDGACTCGNPACSDVGKHPVKELTPKGVKNATSDVEQITKWFTNCAHRLNIGIQTGESSNLTVIDIDIADGKGGAESWQEIVAEHGEPQTLKAITGSGGIHLLFKYNSVLRTASNVFGKGVDCRNDGGYIVAVPSMHRSGGTYEWENELNENSIKLISSLPSFLSRRKETRGRPRKNDVSRSKYTLEQCKSLLEYVHADDRDMWRFVGIILGREYKLSEEAWDLYNEWADKYEGKKGRNHDEIMRECFYNISQGNSEKELTMGTIVKAALEGGWVPKGGEVPIENFIYFGPGNNFIYRPTGGYWIAPAVDAACTKVNDSGKLIDASDWLKQNQLATSMTIDPSMDDDFIPGYDCRNGEVVDVRGAALYNAYRKPTIELGDHKLAKPFIEHTFKIFNKQGDADQFLDYMAHRVQKPWEKPRFALLIAGEQGVGKDTAIEFCTPAIGAWNVANIDPIAFDSQFNEFAAATLIRISEAANLHEMSKWAFNERTKVVIAGSPDTMMINPKYGQKYSVRMYCGVIITTNHLSAGIYIPPDDRRYDVIESATKQEMELESDEERKRYFEELWAWFYDGGSRHVAAYLHNRDISSFSASGGQRKTAAHQTVVAAGFSSDEWLHDILEMLPPEHKAVRVDYIVDAAVTKGEKPGDVKRKVGMALGRAGYSIFRYNESKDGRWRIGKQKTMIYVKNGTPATYDPKQDPVIIGVGERFNETF